MEAAVAQAVAPLVKAAARAILITGTPALSRPIELYPQVLCNISSVVMQQV